MMLVWLERRVWLSVHWWDVGETIWGKGTTINESVHVQNHIILVYIMTTYTAHNIVHCMEMTTRKNLCIIYFGVLVTIRLEDLSTLGTKLRWQDGEADAELDNHCSPFSVMKWRVKIRELHKTKPFRQETHQWGWEYSLGSLWQQLHRDSPLPSTEELQQ